MQPQDDNEQLMSSNPAPKLLIIEDHMMIIKALLLELERHGIKGDQVDYANSAETAIRWLIRKQYSVLLIDLILPGQSGIDFLAQLAKNREEIKSHVIVMTASSSPVLTRLDRSLVKALFFKPLDFRGVASYIAAVS